jgi:exopolysaccharide biosynthesis polyprenyl glycosylphosphotransferase
MRGAPLIQPTEVILDMALQRRTAQRLLSFVRFVLMPLGEALLFVLGGAAACHFLHGPVYIEALMLSGLLVALAIAVLQRYNDFLRGRGIAHAVIIAAAGAAGFSISLAEVLVDMVEPLYWLWLVMAWATTGTALVMLERRLAVVSWAGRLAQRGVADLAVVLSVEAESATATAAGEQLRARLRRPLRLLWQSLPAGDDATKPSETNDLIIDSLRALRPAEVLLVPSYAAAPGTMQPAATGTSLQEALKTLPSRVWQASLETREPQLTLLVDRPMSEFDRVMKRALDIVGALLLIVFMMPLLLVVAAAIKLNSPGPVLFRQRRVGYNNESFEILKFRSMYHATCDVTGSQLTKRGDSRVTQVGRFIRRSSIDELPQLINVLRGEMSLVGPRPYPLRARAGERLYGEVVPNIGLRHRVRPGLTGLAQVSGYRGDTETEDRLIGRFALDLEYLEKWSLWLDIKILLRTPLAGMLKADVY